jgi:hypothetical protein
MKSQRCSPHTTGVPLGTPAFYITGCPACEAKKAAGTVTGDEGPPPDRHLQTGNALNRAAFARGRVTKAMGYNGWRGER